MISEGWQEALMAASKTLLPIPTATGSPHQPTHTSVAPIPSVLPEPVHYETVTTAGARTLWVVFALMLISSATFTFLSWSIPLSKRIFHILTTVITIIATLSYFAMATGHGVSYRHIKDSTNNKHVPDVHYDVYRQVFWARFVDWLLTTPLLLIDLGLLAGMSGGHITMAVLADITMVLTGLFASFGGTTDAQKWTWYAISCFAYVVIIWHLFVNGRMLSRSSDDKVGKFYTSIAGFTLIVWTAYPIIWAISDGSRKLSVDGEIVAYAVLDVLAKGGFGFWLLLTHKRVPETNVDIGGFWAHGTGDEGSLRLTDDGA